MKHSGLITLLMLLGLVGGALFGQCVLHDPTSPLPMEHWTRSIGQLILIRPLMMLIIPLVLVSVVLGVTSVGDPSRLGLIGGATLVFYLTSMAIAATLGATLVTSIKPGQLPPEQQKALVSRAESDFKSSDVAGKIEAAQSASKDNMAGAWRDLLDQLIPTNIVKEMADGRTLGVIFFALLLGLAMAVGGEKCAAAVKVFESFNVAILRMVGWVMWAAPLGVFLLVSWTVGRVGLDALTGPLAKFMFLVIGALAFQALIILPVILLIVGKTNPLTFTWQCRKALMTAFGTASSSATLPVTLETCVDEAGCSRRATNFVVPLGATVNMNGTALFEAVAVVFLCQLYGINLDISSLVIVVITAVLAAIGAAGIPAAGLVTMVIVINAVNVTLPADNKLPPSAMGVIVGVDRIIDMCRTTLNVWADMVGAKIITRIAPDNDG